MYFFVRYGADRPAEEPGAEIGALLDPGRRAFAADITATLANTDPACPVPACYEPATPGLAPATSAYHWRPAPAWRAEGSPRRRSIHHVALRSSRGAARRLNRPSPGSRGPRRQLARESTVQPRGRVNAQGGAVSDLVVASVPPPTGRVCWDLVHAHVDDLRAVTIATVCDRVEVRGHSPAGRPAGRPGRRPAPGRRVARRRRAGGRGVRGPHSTAGRVGRLRAVRSSICLPLGRVRCLWQSRRWDRRNRLPAMSFQFVCSREERTCRRFCAFHPCARRRRFGSVAPMFRKFARRADLLGLEQRLSAAVAWSRGRCG